MKYILFVDDVRDITDTDAAYDFNDRCVVVCRNSAQAMEVVLKMGAPVMMALDHDLGGDDTIMVFLRWMQESGYKAPSFTCHSMNPAGKANVIAFMEAWRKNEES